MRTVAVLMGLACGACASTGAAVKPVASEPVAEVLPAPVWVVSGAWAKLGDVAELMPGFEPGDAFELDMEGGAPVLYAAVGDEQLPAAVRKLRGQRMTAVQENGATCDVVLGQIVVARAFNDTDPGFGLLFDGSVYDDEGEVVSVVAEGERFVKAMEGHSLGVWVGLTSRGGERLQACDDDDYVHHITSSAGRVLDERRASEAELAEGLAALREHGFWEVQQAAYQRSVERLRESSRREYDIAVAAAKKRRAKKDELAEIERERDTRADDAPATWEAPSTGDWEGEEPSGTVWSDGTTRFLLVQTGNGVSCAAPRAWMLFTSEGGELTTLDFGVRAAPTAIYGRAGGFEVASGWPGSVARVVGSRLVVVSELDSSNVSHCGWSQIPPLPNEPN